MLVHKYFPGIIKFNWLSLRFTDKPEGIPTIKSQPR